MGEDLWALQKYPGSFLVVAEFLQGLDHVPLHSALATFVRLGLYFPNTILNEVWVAKTLEGYVLVFMEEIHI